MFTSPFDEKKSRASSEKKVKKMLAVYLKLIIFAQSSLKPCLLGYTIYMNYVNLGPG